MTQETLPVWDLSAYYAGIEDPKIQADIADSSKKAEEFALKYRGKITDTTEPAYILTALQEYEALSLLAEKPALFAQFIYYIDSTKAEHGALVQRTMKAITDLGSVLTFFSLEINNLPAERLQYLANNPILSNYKHYFEKLIQIKPHRLTEKEEIILQQKSLTSSEAFVRLFDEHFGRKKFKVNIDGKDSELSEADILDLMKDPQREKRKIASEAFSKGLEEDTKLLSFIYNTLGEDKSIDDKLTHFTTPDQSRHISNDIDPSVVETMVNVVNENFGVVEDYYNAKREWLGVDQLYEYDRYAPIHQSETRIDFTEAKDIILNAFNRFSPEFTDHAKLFFDKRWIHAPALPGKNGGACCFGGSPDLHPLVLVNYNGRLDDVNTLAHELGHGVNDYYMRDQTPLNYHTTLVLAETASVFAEMLVFDALKDKITDPKEKFGLYVQKIDSIFATVFRQVSMYQFEQMFHNARRTKGELSPEEIDAMWLTSQTKMFGKSVEFSPGYAKWWSYIPHFMQTPFYVYAYAFGELLVLALYAKYKREGESFVPKYLTLMKAGVTASPKELLEPLGIDLTKREFWEGGIKIIKDMVAEAKRLKK